MGTFDEDTTPSSPSFEPAVLEAAVKAVSNLREFSAIGVDPFELITVAVGVGDDEYVYSFELVEVLFAASEPGWLLNHVRSAADLGVLRDRCSEYAEHWTALHVSDVNEFLEAQRGRVLRSADAAELLLRAGVTELECDPFTEAELEARGWSEVGSSDPLSPDSWPLDEADALALAVEVDQRVALTVRRLRAAA